jgi:hypothetical protein
MKIDARGTRRALQCLALVGAALVTATCDDALSPEGELRLGTWGGDDVGLIATDSTTHVHVACTFGDMPGPIELDSEGRLTVDGTYVLRAYPVLVGPPLPAQFSGRVRGATLTLAIAVNDTVENRVVALGPIELTFGRTPGMTNCPICAMP